MNDDQKKSHFDNKLKQDIEELTNWVKQQKIKKFNRDENDYEEGKFYKWTRLTQWETQWQRSVSSNLTSSDEESTSNLSASSPAA